MWVELFRILQMKKTSGNLFSDFIYKCVSHKSGVYNTYAITNSLQPWTNT